MDINALTQNKATTEAPKSTDAFQTLDKDAFLKLLVAQMRYQDPMSPVKGQEFLAQAAQFATVERLEAMSKAQSEALVHQKSLISTALIGRTVKGKDELGEEVEGVVRSVRLTDKTPLLDVDGRTVSFDDVEEVTPPKEDA